MKTLTTGVFLFFACAQVLFAQTTLVKEYTTAEKEIIQLSKYKWDWMAEKNVAELSKLFHEKAEFVHMGGSWGTQRELDVIKNGNIWYKKADILNVSVNIIDKTAILLNRINLLAVVGGNEVINPFIVTEVYVLQGGDWKLGSLSFTRVLSSGNN